MLLALLVYAYCQGVRSSRQIERMCVTDVAFRVLCAQDGPDHATVARFRAEARDVFIDLFSQVLMIAAEAGLGRFGTVAIDGTKIAANASIDANHGKEWFDRHVAGLVAESEDADRDEDTTAAGAADAGLDRVPADLGAWVGNTSLGFSGARDVAVFHCALRAMAAACRRRGCTLDVPDARSTDNRPCGSAAGHEAGQSGDADVAVEFA